MSESQLITGQDGGSGQTISIVAGKITPPLGYGYYKVDTENDAASDTVTTIESAVASGKVLTLRQENSGRAVTLVTNTSNIRLANNLDYTFTSPNSLLMLMFDGTNWVELSRSS
jgi:hypothetical protein